MTMTSFVVEAEMAASVYGTYAWVKPAEERKKLDRFVQSSLFLRRMKAMGRLLSRKVVGS